MWKWSNIALIYRRELRDQLRDRRTMLTVVVLPLLLYPLIGAAFLQVSQFMREHPSSILFWGSGNLPEQPVLLENENFSADLSTSTESRLLQLKFSEPRSPDILDELKREAEQELNSGRHDLVVYFPPDFAEKLQAFRAALRQHTRESQQSFNATIPQPMLFKNTALERSQMASFRVETILRNWKNLIVENNLEQTSVPIAATQPFEVEQADFAGATQKQSLVWSKILPFVLLVWALTGAFYPAIDLCAGEKERGTLETLLCSPALRSEIVWGKLLTVMTFSMATALLNLAGMGFTGWLMVRQLESFHSSPGGVHFGAPPWFAIFWLLVALPPMSALFSALSLAIATFARSSKEGQYYLMPLLLVMLPLMTIPTLPAARLDLGTSLIPVAGLMLLLRALMEGQAWDAIRFSIPVIMVTGACCAMSLRWAVDQFNRESVLFRENEQFGVGIWLRHLLRDRVDTPNFSESMLCAVLILIIGFFGRLFAAMPDSWDVFRNHTIITLIAFIATPAAMMAILLTRRPDRALLLRCPSFIATVPAAVLLAVLLHPGYLWLGHWISVLYPISEQTAELLQPIGAMMKAAPLWQLILTIGLTPAICEELAFRGFILSGFRHLGNKWMAIALSALFFGIAHGMLQQSISASAMGLVLGYLAIKTGSLLPVIAYHFTINSLSVITQRLGEAEFKAYPILNVIFQVRSASEGNLYDPFVAASTLSFAVALLFWFKSLPYESTREEILHDALERETSQTAIGKPATHSVA